MAKDASSFSRGLSEWAAASFMALPLLRSQAYFQAHSFDLELVNCGEVVFELLHRDFQLMALPSLRSQAVFKVGYRNLELVTEFFHGGYCILELVALSLRSGEERLRCGEVTFELLHCGFQITALLLL